MLRHLYSLSLIDHVPQQSRLANRDVLLLWRDGEMVHRVEGIDVKGSEMSR